MSMLKSIQNAVLRAALGNRVMTRIALAIGSSNLGFTTAAAFSYCVNGLTYATSGATVANLVPTHDSFGVPLTASKPAFVQPVSSTVHYVLGINAAGGVAISQGSYSGQVIRDTADLSKVLTGDGAIPAEPGGYVAFGLITVATNGSTTFTPGTTALNASGVTATFRGVAMLPESI
jgi:hypothetical protein